jgi:hypothetical protein
VLRFAGGISGQAGGLEAANNAARTLELEPEFRFSRQFKSMNCVLPLAASLRDTHRVTALPE